MGHCRNRTGRIRQLSSFWENRMFALHSPDTLCPSQAKKGHHSLSCSLDTATCPTQNWHDAPQPLPNVHKIVKERQGFHQNMQSLEARRARQKPFPQADRTGPVSQTAGDCQATQGRKKTFPPECKLNCPSRHGTNNADRSHTLKRQQEWDQVRAQKRPVQRALPKILSDVREPQNRPHGHVALSCPLCCRSAVSRAGSRASVGQQMPSLSWQSRRPLPSCGPSDPRGRGSGGCSGRTVYRHRHAGRGDGSDRRPDRRLPGPDRSTC